jgi:hypothetical protein
MAGSARQPRPAHHVCQLAHQVRHEHLRRSRLVDVATAERIEHGQRRVLGSRQRTVQSTRFVEFDAALTTRIDAVGERRELPASHGSAYAKKLRSATSQRRPQSAPRC